MAKNSVASRKRVQRSNAKELAKELSNLPIFGEIITWQVKQEVPRTHKDVVRALTKAGLDPDQAKKIMPKFAFSRACKKLSDKAMFDVVKDTNEMVKFQMTKKSMQNEDWVYAKETQLILNKTTGDIKCAKKDIQDLAQKLLNDALEIRTTADISQMIQKLFEKNGDLFSIRDQGGVYFVPVMFLPFVTSVETFVDELGGEMGRFPIPRGTSSGDRSIQNSIADAFMNLIKDHESAIDEFTITTRADTMNGAAEKISVTRVKIEAYADYLQDKSKELLKAADDAKKKLEQQISKLAEDKLNAPEATDEIYGHSITSIIRWMGANDWSFQDASKVLTLHGAVVAKSTIRGQLWVGGSKRDQFGKPAELDDKAAKKLEIERKKQ